MNIFLDSALCIHSLKSVRQLLKEINRVEAFKRFPPGFNAKVFQMTFGFDILILVHIPQALASTIFPPFHLPSFCISPSLLAFLVHILHIVLSCSPPTPTVSLSFVLIPILSLPSFCAVIYHLSSHPFAFFP
jgi:hypothetical protein